MMEPLYALFANESYMPHGHCYLWQPELLWLYVASDLVIGIAYYSIPIALVYFTRHRKDLKFHWLFILFSIFIFACGTTHFIAIWTIWEPVYWLDAFVKGVTALVSIATAVLLWPIIPKALSLPSPADLQSTIIQKDQEMFERKQVEAELARLNETLETRVMHRTSELNEINQRLEAEIELRKAAEEGFRKVIEHAPNGMVMTSESGVIEMVNQQTEKIFGYQRAELLGQSIEILVPAGARDYHPQLRQSFFGQPDSRAMGEGRDLYGLRKNGSEVPVEIALNPIATDAGAMVLAAIVDISDRKQKEGRIRASLREKTTLLAEVHHRVKNNLQLVHSLLDLQASQADDPLVADILSNSMRRIKSMATIHQALYQSNDFSEVDLHDVLKTLVDNLANSFNTNIGQVNVTVDVESVRISLTQAVPCGLIVNELVTNALKYAFPDNRAGEVVVSLKLDEHGKATLSVVDNGVGMDSDIDLDNLSSLGLELVSVLTEQINGQLSINSSNPTRFDIQFQIS